MNVETNFIHELMRVFDGANLQIVAKGMYTCIDIYIYHMYMNIPLYVYENIHIHACICIYIYI